ncbi:MAG: baseplate J/gp47 family protein [Aliidongia sp.]
MAITGQSFTNLVTGMVAAAKSATTVALDFTVGSINLALVQSVAGVALWLQGLILLVLAQSRAATSQQSDLDSWMADFGFVRLAPAAAVGAVTFARFQPTAAAIIPVGSLVATAVGGAQFMVTADPTNGAYNTNAGGTGVGGYVLAAGVGSLTVAAVAVTPGSAGNILAGAISLLLQPINGIDTATNNAAFTGGADPERDIAFRARFQAFLAQLMKGTDTAISFALNSLQSDLTFRILENTNPVLATQLGFVTVCLDDGTGNPPVSLLQAANAAAEAVRCAGITIGIIPPQVVTASVAMTLTSIIAANHAADQTAAVNALTVFIDALPVGAPLPFSRLTQIAYDASPNISNVTGVTLNGGAADLTVSTIQVIKTGTLRVN